MVKRKTKELAGKEDSGIWKRGGGGSKIPGGPAKKGEASFRKILRQKKGGREGGNNKGLKKGKKVKEQLI